MRWRRRWLIGIALVALLLVIAGSFLWHPLRQYAARVTLRQLEAAYGGRVTADVVSLRLAGIELQGVRLWEATGPGEAPNDWLTIRHMRIQVPLARALDDPPPVERIDLQGVRARVPLGASGEIQLRLPVSSASETPRIPTDHITARDVEIELLISGSPPRVIRDFSVSLDRDGDQANWMISGEVGQWWGASWSFTGELERDFQRAETRVVCQRLAIDWRELATLPWIPFELPSVVESLEADAVVDLDWRILWSATESLEHAGTARLFSGSVRLPDHSLAVQLDSGSLAYQDDRWEFSDVLAELFDGQVQFEGQLHWGAESPRLIIEGRAARLDVESLPLEALGFTNDFQGRGEGTFSLRANLSSNGTMIGTMEGEAAGQILAPRWRHLAAEPVFWNLQLDEWQYDFANSQPLDPQGILSVQLAARDLQAGDLASLFPNGPASLRELSGEASGELRATVDLASWSDVTSYSAEGSFRLASLEWRSVPWAELSGRGSWRDGIATLEDVQGNGVMGERLTGSGLLAWDPPGNLSLQLALDQVPLETLPSRLLPLIPEPRRETLRGLDDQLAGQISMNASLTVPIHQWQDLATWQARGSVHLDEFTTLGQTIRQPSVEWRYEQLRIELSELRGDWNAIPLKASGQLSLESPQAFQLRMDLPDRDGPELLAALGMTMPLDWSGRVTGSGQILGNLEFWEWEATGNGFLRDVVLDDDVMFSEVSFFITADQREGKLGVEPFAWAGGWWEVNARLPFSDVQPSEITLEMRDIESADLVALLDKLPEIPRLPETPRGRISGILVATGWEGEETASLMGQLTTRQFELGPLLLEQGTAQLELRSGQGNIRADGDLLGGRVRLGGSSPLNLHAPDPWSKVDFQGEVTLENLRLENAVRRLSRVEAEQLRDLAGQASAVVSIAWRPGEKLPRVEGRGELREVRWGRDELLPSADGELFVAGSSWELRNLRGRMGRGTISGQINGPLTGQGPGSFNLTATRLEVRRLLAPWPDVARQVEGMLDARVRGRFDSAWRGTAELFVTRGRLAGTDLDRFRLPVDWAYLPTRRRVSLNMRETTIRLAQGRAVVRGEVDWDRELDLKGQARLVSLDLRSLLGGVRSPSAVPRGRLSGQLEFSGSRVRAARDLRGSFVGTLDDAQALRLPVMNSLVPALGSGGQMASSVFDESDIRLSLARGRVEVERLALASSAVQLLATGDVTLEGRLALDVTANIGQINTRTPLARALQASLLVSAPPVQLALLTQANRWLSNRLIFLRVGGTTRNPTVQLRPGETLGREAIQFFLQEASGGWLGSDGGRYPNLR